MHHIRFIPALSPQSANFTKIEERMLAGLGYSLVPDHESEGYVLQSNMAGPSPVVVTDEDLDAAPEVFRGRLEPVVAFIDKQCVLDMSKTDIHVGEILSSIISQSKDPHLHVIVGQGTAQEQGYEIIASASGHAERFLEDAISIDEERPDSDFIATQANRLLIQDSMMAAKATVDQSGPTVN